LIKEHRCAGWWIQMAHHVQTPKTIRWLVPLRSDRNFQPGIRIRLLTPVVAV
jgi:hypothetical protein